MAKASKPPVPGSGNRTRIPPEILALEARLLAAWRAGDLAACEVEWEQLWRWLFPMAFAFCRKLCRDEATARAWATAGVAEAWMEIDHKLRNGKEARAAEGEFVAWIVAYVIFRCRDQAGEAFRRDKKISHDDTHDGGQREVAVDAPQEELLVLDQRDRGSLRRFIATLNALRVRAAAAPVLVALIDQILVYLAESLAATVADKARVVQSRDLAELVDLADIALLDVEKTPLRRFLQERLRITSGMLSVHLYRLGLLFRALEASDG